MLPSVTETAGSGLLVKLAKALKERNFILFLSLLVGIVSGLAAVLLKNMVHYTHLFFTERLQVDSGDHKHHREH